MAAPSRSRVVLVAFAGLVLVLASAFAVREDALPSWAPETFRGLTIRAGDAAELGVTRDEASAYASSRLFFGSDPDYGDADTFPVRVTGRVPPEKPKPVPLAPSVQLVFREVERHPAWLVVWRDVDGTALGGQPVPRGVDVVCFVDGETGVFLTACTFIDL